MTNIQLNNLEKEFSSLSIEELLEIEEKIMRIMKEKIKKEKGFQNWKKDFLEISVWSHLNEKHLKRIKGIKIKKLEKI